MRERGPQKDLVSAAAAEMTARDSYHEQTEVPESGTKAVSDERLAAQHRSQRPEDATRVVLGTIVDAVPGQHAYRVLVEGMGVVRPCIWAGQLPLLPHGARYCGSLSPGTRVWCILHEHLHYGVIVCVHPTPQTDAFESRSDWIFQGSGVGYQVDLMHRIPLSLQWSGGAVVAAGDRPLDALTVPEWGVFSETGLRFWLDGLMLQAAVSETCGLFAFYQDDLLRLSGYNLELFSAAQEWRSLNDRLELHVVRKELVYPWELMGAAFPQPAMRKYAPAAYQIEQPYWAKYEPSDDRLQPLARWLEQRGYLGQPLKVLVQAPRNPGVLWRYEDTDVGMNALAEQKVALDGTLGWRSSRRIVLAKYPAIPAEKPLYRPEDEKHGDYGQYKYSGIMGDGPDHKVRDSIQPTALDVGLQCAAGFMDQLSYVFNWVSRHVSHYHKKDWRVEEESETGRRVWAPPFGYLVGGHLLPPPPQSVAYVDHRVGYARIFQSAAFVSIEEDGSIVLGDGYGAEIRMSHGSIWITAPGDVFIGPGRNAVMMGGHDVNIKANHSLDLSTTQYDVRIKSERNLHVLAGNSGQGGVLVESLSPTQFAFVDEESGEPLLGERSTSGGIIFKAPKGVVATWAQSIYLRTGGGDVQDGDIIFDAAAGRRWILGHAESLLEFTRQGRYTYMGDYTEEAGRPKTAAIFTPQFVMLPGYTAIDGGLAVMKNGAIINGYVGIFGHIGSTEAEAFDYYVGAYTGESLRKFQGAFSRLVRSIEQSFASGGAVYKGFFPGYVYRERVGFGNRLVIQQVQFTHRTPDQYMTQDFRYWESRWQRLARITGTISQIWQEREAATGYGTMPYPGREPLVDEETYWIQPARYFDDVGGLALDREAGQGLYEDPQFPEPQRYRFNEVYPVTSH